MDYLEKFAKLNTIQELLKNFDSISHAIILTSEDEIFLDCFAKLIVMQKNCNGQKKPCFDCVNCKKIVDGNSVDVEYFGTDKPIVVDDSLQIVADSFVVPLELDKKYFILKNFDLATTSAQNKLLKVIEEPQSFDTFILLTTNLNAVLPTIKSRCEVHSLPRLSQNELQFLFEYRLNEARKYNIALEYANGNLTALETIYDDESFLTLYELAIKTLTLMQNSSKILEFASEISKYKTELDKFLEIVSSFYFDMLKIKNGKPDAVQNKQVFNQLNLLCNGYSEYAIINILKEIDQSNLKLKFNANQNAVVDNLLLKILEIKHICK